MLGRCPIAGVIVCAAAATIVAASGPTAARRTRHHTVQHQPQKKRPAVALPCGTVLDFQVRLDRARFSPGEIDGAIGDNFRHALTAFQSTHKLQPSGEPDCDTWSALGGDTAAPATVDYRITDADVKGPFLKRRVPDDMLAMAKLPSLGYVSPLEELGERFHSAPALLRRLNPHSRFAAGETIHVPGVEPFDADAKPNMSAEAPDVIVSVTKADSALKMTNASGELLFYAPVSSGSTHDPLPIGDWSVTVVQWHPAFRYNPELFWDAEPSHTKALIKPGPNNPVGVVWIGLDLEHYGVHGTPVPGHVGHTESHGCVRLTNWDAARVAASVRKGTRVEFRAGPSGPASSAIEELRQKALRLPIDGMDVEKLKGSFAEEHSGHAHEAVDILAPRGTPIHAVEDGTIAKLFDSKAGGHTIYQFDPSQRYCYYYAHLDRYADGLADGQRVRRGQVIGYVGTSGNAPPDTPHLHFTIFELTADKHWWEGRPIDPYLVLHPA